MVKRVDISLVDKVVNMRVLGVPAMVFSLAGVPAYAVEEGVRTVGWNRTSAMKVFGTHGRCVIMSAIQRVMQQVLLEKYGGAPWTYQILREVFRDWLSVEGFNKAKTLAAASENGVSLGNAVRSEMARRAGQNCGSIRQEITIQRALAGGLFPIRGVRNDTSLDLTINFIHIRIRVSSKLVGEGLLQMDDQVNVDFPIFEARN